MNKAIELTNGKTINMSCPTVKTVKNAMKTEGGMSQTIYILSAVCNMSPDEIESLPFPDYVRLAEELDYFLEKQAI